MSKIVDKKTSTSGKGPAASVGAVGQKGQKGQKGRHEADDENEMDEREARRELARLAEEEEDDQDLDNVKDAWGVEPEAGIGQSATHSVDVEADYKDKGDGGIDVQRNGIAMQYMGRQYWLFAVPSNPPKGDCLFRGRFGALRQQPVISTIQMLMSTLSIDSTSDVSLNFFNIGLNFGFYHVYSRKITLDRIVQYHSAVARDQGKEIPISCILDVQDSGFDARYTWLEGLCKGANYDDSDSDSDSGSSSGSEYSRPSVDHVSKVNDSELELERDQPHTHAAGDDPFTINDVYATDVGVGVDRSVSVEGMDAMEYMGSKEFNVGVDSLDVDVDVDPLGLASTAVTEGTTDAIFDVNVIEEPNGVDADAVGDLFGDGLSDPFSVSDVAALKRKAVRPPIAPKEGKLART